MSRHPSKVLASWVVCALVVLPTCARAQALRLRADALAQTRSPVGLVQLTGTDKVRPWLDAEAVTWLGMSGGPAGADALSPTGDVVTVSVRARDARSGSEARVGRMVVTMGAVRPVHLDGARGLARVLGGTTLEAFAGVPVQRGFDYRQVGFATGGRVGQAFGATTIVGASYLRRTTDGALSDEELGADLALTPAPWLTAQARGAFDLIGRGPSDVLVSASVQREDLRVELFTTHRSPGRLLPATSLFSVLGDFAATSSGSTVRYRMFPRLEVVGQGTVQVRGDDVGGQGTGRVTLALDDDFAGTIGLEVRRVVLGDARWTGARALAAVPVLPRFRVATEVELVRPDDPRGRGELWPWVLFAVGYRPSPGWDVGVGIETSSGPEYRARTAALARLSYAFAGGEVRR